MKRLIRMAAVMTVMMMSVMAHGRGVYQDKNEFISEAFGGRAPVSGLIWLTGDIKTGLEAIMGHPYNSTRIRYWTNGKRSAWILDETGKEELITTGIVVNDGKIELVRILEYRESRGDEVRHGFFTDQFRGAGRKDSGVLDRNIDGISGATLSVAAVTRLAALALYLDGRRAREP